MYTGRPWYSCVVLAYSPSRKVRLAMVLTSADESRVNLGGKPAVTTLNAS